MDDIVEPEVEDPKEDQENDDIEEESEVVVHRPYKLSLLFLMKLMDEKVEQQSFVFTEMLTKWHVKYKMT